MQCWLYRGFLEQRRIELLIAKAAHRGLHCRLQQPYLANPVGTASFLDQPMMQIEDFFPGEELHRWDKASSAGRYA